MIAPASNVPPTVDTVHGRACNCHRCAPVVIGLPTMVHPNAAALVAATFNQGKV